MVLTHPELDAMLIRLQRALPQGAEGALGAVVKDHKILIEKARQWLNGVPDGYADRAKKD